MATRERDGWELLDPQPFAEANPDTWETVSRESLNKVQRGQIVKLLFSLPNGVERMWVAVDSSESQLWKGIMLDDPADEDAWELLPVGKAVYFPASYVVSVGSAIFSSQDIQDLIDNS